MRVLGNFLWFILLGWWNALLYIALGVLWCITIIGIPIGKAMFQYAKLMAFPFGKVIVKETFIKGKENVSIIRHFFGTLANIIWLPFGIATFIGNIGMMLVCFISIIFIPFGIVIAKSCKFLLWPVGAKVISKEDEMAINVANRINRQAVNVVNNSPVVAVNAPTTVINNVAEGNFIFCPQCGKKLVSTARFCDKCGNALK